MALFGRVLGTALLIGGGALAVAAVVAAPKILRASRPVVREALRRSIALYDKARAAAAEFADDVEDLVAEVRAKTPERETTSEAADKTAKSA
jgi:hypothetical protein